MKVSLVSSFYNNTTFKSDSKTSNEKYVKYLEKREYVSKKLETLDDLSTLAFLGALLTGAITLDLSKNMKPTEKLSAGLMVAAGALLGAKWIKGHQLSKQYDAEHNNEN